MHAGNHDFFDHKGGKSGESTGGTFERVPPFYHGGIMKLPHNWIATFDDEQPWIHLRKRVFNGSGQKCWRRETLKFWYDDGRPTLTRISLPDGNAKADTYTNVPPEAREKLMAACEERLGA